jgi:mannose-6-phosphate isomerase
MLRYDQPWRLTPDNFTPPTRTPWGGRKIPDLYKKDLPLSPEKRAYACVGESWEVSTDAQFPSRLVDHDLTLEQAIALNPQAALGREGGLPYLVKWLDAKSNLSVQVHPTDDYAGLKTGECGKPECWFIVDAEPGAVLYLGWRDGVTSAEVRDALVSGETLDKLMNAVPVRRGDLFEIKAGTVHALGAGIALIEPQAVLPGKSGVTYRVWDWNRRYDDNGVETPAGKPRELHVEHSLAVANFSLTGDALLEKAKCKGDRIHTPAFDCGVLEGSGAKALPQGGIALTVVSGAIEVAGILAVAGESIFAPAQCVRAVMLTDALLVWTG